MNADKLWLQTYGNKLWRLEHLYKIRDKSRKTVNLVLNKAQRAYWENKSNRDIILKARQLGFSTLCLIDDLDDVMTHRNFDCLIMADCQDDLHKLFRIIHFAYDTCPDDWCGVKKPKATLASTHELYFKDINSRIYVALKGKADTINKLHVSEAAMVKDPDTVFSFVFQTVPKTGSIVLESTPKGIGNWFHERWEESQGRQDCIEQIWKGHFFPWWYDLEYSLPLTTEEQESLNRGQLWDDEELLLKRQEGLTDEQLKWRRYKKAELLDMFDEQYPEDDITCFLGSGNNYFDTTALREQLMEMEE